MATGDFQLPFFGNFLSAMDNLKYDVKICNKYDKIAVCQFGTESKVYVTDPELCRKAAGMETRLTELDNMMAFSGYSNQFEKNNIFTTNGQIWQDMRNLFNPAFNLASTQTYTKVIQECVEDFMLVLKSKCQDGQELDALQFSKNLTLQVFLKAGFGAELSINNPKDRQDMFELLEDSKAFFKVLKESWIAKLLVLLPEVGSFLVKQAVRTGKMEEINVVRLAPGKTSERIINEHAKVKSDNLFDVNGFNKKEENFEDQYFKANAAKGSSLQNFQDWQKFRGPGLLWELMKRGTIVGKPFDQIMRVSNLTILLLAGHETTATTICFALFELARRQELQAKLLEEIDKFGRSRPLTENDFDQFPYTKAVINETLRLYTPLVSSYRRVISKEIKLGDYVVPPRSTLILPLRGIHLTERYWPKPYEFHPERFLGNKDLECKVKNAFLPFGYGPRICIGMKLAWNESLISLIKIFQQYTFTSQYDRFKEIELNEQFVISPQEQLKIQVQERS